VGAANGKLTTGTDLILRRCDAVDESQTFKLHPDGRLHFDDTYCLGAKLAGAAQTPAVETCGKAPPITLMGGQVRSSFGCLQVSLDRSDNRIRFDPSCSSGQLGSVRRFTFGP
jgi:hypothetical protein